MITLALNSEATIKYSIESVNNQNYEDIEHILVDGGSADNTVEVFRENAKRNPKIISERDEGIYDAMNKGWLASTGDIIGFLNSDDVYYQNNSLTEIARSFKRGVDAVHGNLFMVNSRGTIKRIWNSRNFRFSHFSYSMSPAHPTLYCRKEVFVKLGGFNKKFRIAGDIDFMIRLFLSKEFRLVHVNSTLVIMKTLGESTRSFGSKVIITREVKESFKNNGLKFNSLKYWIGKTMKYLYQSSYILNKRLLEGNRTKNSNN